MPQRDRRFGSTGIKLPLMGLGAAPLGNVMGEVSDDAAAALLDLVCKEPGKILIDTAPHYGLGLSESRIGRLLGTEQKKRVTFSTKVGRVPDYSGEKPVSRFDFSREGVLRSIEQSLERLGVEKLDIVHIHDPDAHFDKALHEAFGALAELKAQGVVGAISAGMNQWRMLLDFLGRAPFDGFLLAGRYSLMERGAETEFLPACQRHGAGLIVGGVFNSGILADPRANQRYNYQPAPAHIIARALALEAICVKHGVALKAAALQFPLRHEAVSAIVVGAKSAAEWAENQRLLAEPIAEAVWDELATARLDVDRDKK